MYTCNVLLNFPCVPLETFCSEALINASINKQVKNLASIIFLNAKNCLIYHDFFSFKMSINIALALAINISGNST